MRDPDRIDKIMDVLTEVWKEFPDWRFGQLIANISPYVTEGDIFFPEDDKWLEGIKAFQRDMGRA